MSKVTDLRSGELVYQGEHFEARPLAGGQYILLWRKEHDEPAFDRPFPEALAEDYVRLLERGYQLGATASVEFLMKETQQKATAFIEYRKGKPIFVRKIFQRVMPS